MDYLYENLGPERFQEFCQALLLQEEPGLQCFPVAQPDGGRDAIRFVRAPRGEFSVYQVKYARQPARQDDPARWVEDAVAGELKKIQRLAERGAKQYYVVTNVSGSAHLGGGTIDRVSEYLAANVPIPATCLWRDDLNRRLDGTWDLKWAYPELLSGPDVLRLVLESGLKEDATRRTNAIRAFVAAQFEADSEVKFRQIELQNDLLDLFVDVPARLAERRAGRRHRVSARHLVRHLGPEILVDVDQDSGPDYAMQRDPTVLAAGALLHDQSGEHLARLVIEGAPGQGKSTVVQYICQVNRIRVLGRQSELTRLPEAHVQGRMRLPIKTDLRDLATWLDGRNPFDAEAEDGRPPDWERSLEAFLAAQVRHLSGGATFSVSDLQEVLRLSATLLVFDGLDEVADLAGRSDVVKEVERGVKRLQEVAASLQVVVTTRPAAFSNAPGFSPADFGHFELVALPKSLIEKYTERWLVARRLSQKEAADVRRLLRSRLELAHIRELARNPMQLAILLSVVHTKGSSLPDKRTALYDEYVDIFLDREAEKSAVVREYRELLVDIHRFLGWYLHAAAERGSYRRGIPTEELKQLIDKYLQKEGHETGLLDELFRGMVERVVALVSRVEGTFEFEVQPLREYFAAKHLYVTAPLSPPGDEQIGTKPDRFDALARDFYWLNVVRFYSGCYGKGELASLVEGLEELSKADGFRNTSHPRELAGMLLADYVFAQNPRATERVVALLLDEIGLHHLVRTGAVRRGVGEPLQLPDKSGRLELVTRAFDLMRRDPPAESAVRLAELLRGNATADELRERWLDGLPDARDPGRVAWFRLGLWLGVLGRLDSGTVETAMRQDSAQELALVVEAGHASLVESDEARARLLVEAILDGHASISWLRRAPGSAIAAANLALTLPAMDSANWWPGNTLEEVVTRQRGAFDDLPERDGSPTIETCQRVFGAFKKHARQRVEEWTTSLDPWNEVIEAGRQDWGDRWLLMVMAANAAGITAKEETASDTPDLFDQEAPLARRARYARLRAGTPEWWRRTLSAAPDSLHASLAVLIATAYASQRTLQSVLDELEGCVAGLSDEEFSRLVRALDPYGHASGRQAKPVTLPTLDADASERLVILFGTVASRPERWEIYQRHLADYGGGDPTTVRFALDSELIHGQRSQHDWEKVAELARRIYGPSFGGGLLRDWAYQMPPPGLSKELAFAITDHPEAYPIDLVVLAEARCREIVAESITPVAEVAETQAWFTSGRL